MIHALWRKRLYRPEAVGRLARDLAGPRGPALDPRMHLDEAARWVRRAQAATPDDGVAGAYSFEDGWVASYPETTGYLIPTLLTYAERADRPAYTRRALRMAEWELTVQHESGGFPGHFVDRAHPPVVFNTGQVIFGLLAAYETSADSRFLVAARRAGAWLMDVQAADGAWRRFDYRDTVHAYNTRTAWALAELGLATGERAFVAAATRHLDWACDQQRPNGWIRHCGFDRDEDPFLHTIAYAAQGLLEAGLRLDRPEYVTAGQHVCQALLDRMAPNGFLPATFDETWRPTARYSCLTGNAQLALQWLRLHAILGDPEYLVAARHALTLLKRLQDCRTPNRHIRGALPGSYPIWGRYLFGTYPNWAVKFFMDALMAEDAVRSGEGKCIRCW